MSEVGRRWSRVLLALLLAALLASGPGGEAQAQPLAPRYFSQTGHFLRGAFRSFWERSGGVALFGYPITEEYIRRSDGKLVQYFERARYELRISGGQAFVDLGLIGREFTAGRDFGRIGPFPSTGFQRYFPETGHSLRGAFKRFWEGRGGLPIYGFPISEEINEQLGGQIYLVQYFERSRYELVGSSVRLGLLGSALAPCALRGRLPANAPPGGPLDEPADTRPCQGQPAPAPAGARAYPSPARPGTVLGFEARGYEPNETVSLWLNVPGQGARALPYQAIAASDGGVLIGFRIQENDPVGNWSIVGHGTRSGRQYVAYFQIRY
jgi:hypothetical protein